MKRILTLLAAIVCLCSCEKQEKSHWLHKTWSGVFDITMENNNTGEKEPHVGTIYLMFSEDRSECEVVRGVNGHYTSTMERYKVYLNDTEKIFVLNNGDYDSRIQYRGNITEDGKCLLNSISDMLFVELTAHKVE